MADPADLLPGHHVLVHLELPLPGGRPQALCALLREDPGAPGGWAAEAYAPGDRDLEAQLHALGRHSRRLDLRRHLVTAPPRLADEAAEWLSDDPALLLSLLLEGQAHTPHPHAPTGRAELTLTRVTPHPHPLQETP